MAGPEGMMKFVFLEFVLCSAAQHHCHRTIMIATPQLPSLAHHIWEGNVIATREIKSDHCTMHGTNRLA